MWRIHIIYVNPLLHSVAMDNIWPKFRFSNKKGHIIKINSYERHIYIIYIYTQTYLDIFSYIRMNLIINPEYLCHNSNITFGSKFNLTKQFKPWCWKLREEMPYFMHCTGNWPRTIHESIQSLNLWLIFWLQIILVVNSVLGSLSNKWSVLIDNLSKIDFISCFFVDFAHRNYFIISDFCLFSVYIRPSQC